MKTAIQKAIDDIKGYRSFSEKIDIRFVCALLKVYMDEEEAQIKSAFYHGEKNMLDSIKEKNSDGLLSPSEFFKKTFDNYQ